MGRCTIKFHPFPFTFSGTKWFFHDMSHSNSHGFPHEKPVPRFIALRVSWNGSSSSGSGGPWGIPSCSQYSLARFRISWGTKKIQGDPWRWMGLRENLHRKPWFLPIKYRVVLRIFPSSKSMTFGNPGDFSIFARKIHLPTHVPRCVTSKIGPCVSHHRGESTS